MLNGSAFSSRGDALIYLYIYSLRAQALHEEIFQRFHARRGINAACIQECAEFGEQRVCWAFN